MPERNLPLEPDSTALDTREILWKVRRYRWLALLPIVTVLCVAYLYLKFATPLYESAVTITLGDRPQVSAALQPLVNSDQPREVLVEKVARVKNRVLNRSFLELICTRLGLNRGPKLVAAARAAVRKYPGITADDYAMRIATLALSKMISVTPAGASYVRIAVREPDPDMARSLAVAISEALIEDTRRVTLGQAQARGEFSQDQIVVYTEKLHRSEDALRQYQESLIGRKALTGPVSDENLQSVRELGDATDKEMETIRARILSDRSQWTTYTGQDTPIPDLTSATTSELQNRLDGLEVSYGVAAIQPRERGSESQTLLSQIGPTRQDLLREFENLSSQVPGGLPPAARELVAGIALDRAVLRSLQARRSRLKSLVGEFLQTARSSPREQMELERLKNDVQTNRDLLATLQKEATSSRLSEALDTSQLNDRIDVVESPQLPFTPVAPDRVKILAAAFLLGPLFSIGAIVAAERMGAILRTVEQAEKEIGVKVIGTIPRIEGWSRPGTFIQNNWAPISILLVLLLTVVATGIRASLSPRPGGSAVHGELRR
jgi:uncharacterized protein involved in exopolysaccharide biosynthesis